MTRRNLAALAAAATALAPAAGAAPAAAVTPAPTAATVAKCATSPTKIAFARAARAKTGRLSWSAPKKPKSKKLTYRVLRNGKRVAQTTKRSVKLSVKVGRTYRFAVAVVRGGRVQAKGCRATRSVTVAFLAPSTPKAFKAAVSAGTAALSWQKSRNGDGTLAGYRVFKDGRTVRQYKATRASVPVSATAATVLSVRAVDTKGHMSSAASVTLAGPAPAAAAAPSVPGGLRATAVSDSGVNLAWDPAQAGSGARVVGYRVFRDGATLGQVEGTELSVPRLETAEAYTFTVVAVDNAGRLSAPSRALTVSTNPPPPSTGTLNAFLLASTGTSFDDFKAHYRQVGAIHPTYFECNTSTAQVEGRDDPQITRYAKVRQVEVYARFNCQSGPVLHQIITDPALRGAWLATMTNLAVQNGYDGVNLDFEAGDPTDRAAFTSFVTELAARLHAIGKKLAVDVSAKTADSLTHPRSGLYDYPALANVADTVFVMAWGIHWSTSAPGPVADMPWLQAIVAYVNTLPNRSKYVMGTPMYGMDWPRSSGTGVPATALEWGDIAGLAAQVGATPAYDSTAHETHFSYTDGAGLPHEVWASNAGAVLERMRMFHANGYGLGVWRLGREDQTMWSDPLLAS
jgi:spore germination protein YaaH